MWIFIWWMLLALNLFNLIVNVSSDHIGIHTLIDCFCMALCGYFIVEKARKKS